MGTCMQVLTPLIMTLRYTSNRLASNVSTYCTVLYCTSRELLSARSLNSFRQWQPSGIDMRNATAKHKVGPVSRAAGIISPLDTDIMCTSNWLTSNVHDENCCPRVLSTVSDNAASVYVRWSLTAQVLVWTSENCVCCMCSGSTRRVPLDRFEYYI